MGLSKIKHENYSSVPVTTAVSLHIEKIKSWPRFLLSLLEAWPLPLRPILQGTEYNTVVERHPELNPLLFISVPFFSCSPIIYCIFHYISSWTTKILLLYVRCFLYSTLLQWEYLEEQKNQNKQTHEGLKKQHGWHYNIVYFNFLLLQMVMIFQGGYLFTYGNCETSSPPKENEGRQWEESRINQQKIII